MLSTLKKKNFTVNLFSETCKMTREVTYTNNLWQLILYAITFIVKSTYKTTVIKVIFFQRLFYLIQQLQVEGQEQKRYRDFEICTTLAI